MQSEVPDALLRLYDSLSQRKINLVKALKSYSRQKETINRQEFTKFLNNNGITTSRDHQTIIQFLQKHDQRHDHMDISQIIKAVNDASKQRRQMQNKPSKPLQQYCQDILKNEDFDILDIISLIDNDHKGLISKEDFYSLIINIVQDQQKFEKEIEQDFKKLSAKNQGKGIQYEDLQQYLKPNIQLGEDSVHIRRQFGLPANPQSKETMDNHLSPPPQLHHQQNPQIQPQEQPPEIQLRYQNSNDATQSVMMMQDSRVFQSVRVNQSDIPGVQQFLFYYQNMIEGDFIDPEFPLDHKTIGVKFKDIYALKQGMLFNGKVKIFSKNTKSMLKGLFSYLSADDICQGQLGDCYFLSSLASLVAKYPQIVLGLFISQKINASGVYCVKLCVNGTFQGITLDDSFPAFFNGREHQPAFSKGQNNELWVMLLEKAWAKLAGSYQSIESGICSEVLRALTGAPTRSMNTLAQNFLEKFTQYIKQDFVLTASAGGDNPNVQIKQTNKIANQFGLVGSHAYSVLGLEVIQDRQGKYVTLIKLRNPWAKVEWNGDWSNNSPLWSEAQRKKFLEGQVGRGIFYMDINCFVQHFVNVDVCMVHKEYVRQSLKVNTTKKNAAYFSILVSTPGIYYITINQPNKRLLFAEADFNEVKLKKFDNYTYSLARLIVSEVDLTGDKRKFIHLSDCQLKSAETHVKVHLNPGLYTVYAKVEWSWTQKSDFVLSVYGCGVTNIDRIQKIDGFKQQSMLDKARKNSKNQKSFEQHGHCALRAFQIERKDAFGYFYIFNLSERIFRVQVQLTQAQGVRFHKVQGSQLQYDVMPQSEQVILLSKAEQYQLGYSERASFI